MADLIVHKQNTLFFDSQTVSGAITSDPININGYSLYCVQHVWSGASGSWQIIVEGTNFNTSDDAYYTTVDITNITASNVPTGNRMLNVEKAGYAYVRVRIAHTSGGGTLTSLLNGKVL
jgi:hypothetical protein